MRAAIEALTRRFIFPDVQTVYNVIQAINLENNITVQQVKNALKFLKPHENSNPKLRPSTGREHLKQPSTGREHLLQPSLTEQLTKFLTKPPTEHCSISPIEHALSDSFTINMLTPSDEDPMKSLAFLICARLETVARNFCKQTEQCSPAPLHRWSQNSNKKNTYPPFTKKQSALIRLLSDQTMLFSLQGINDNHLTSENPIARGEIVTRFADQAVYSMLLLSIFPKIQSALTSPVLSGKNSTKQNQNQKQDLLSMATRRFLPCARNLLIIQQTRSSNHEAEDNSLSSSVLDPGISLRMSANSAGSNIGRVWNWLVQHVDMISKHMLQEEKEEKEKEEEEEEEEKEEEEEEEDKTVRRNSTNGRNTHKKSK